MIIQPIQSQETYQQYEDQLNPGNNLFACGGCNHKIGDPRSHNFIQRCDGCGGIVRHYRIID